MNARPIALSAVAVAVALSAGALALVDGGGPPIRVTDAADTARVSASIAFFEARLAADPLNRTVATQLAGRYVLRFQQSARLDDLERAEQLAREARPLALDPVVDDARLSALMLMQHRFAEAYEFAARAVAGDADREVALGALFDASLATGRYATVDSLIEIADRSALSWQVRRAQWLDANGESRSAASIMDDVCVRLDRAESRPVARAWCLVELAGFTHGAEGAAAAERTLHRALRMQPGYRGAIEGLADLAHARRQWNRARELYLEIATDAHPDLYLRLAEVHRELERDAEAHAWEIKFLDVAMRPGTEPLFALPLALHLAATPEARGAALAVAMRDLERRQAIETWDVLAWIHFLRRENDLALAASDSALRWGSASPTTLYHRARILDAAGRAGEAGALMRDALADPTLLEPHARFDARRAGHLRNYVPVPSNAQSALSFGLKVSPSGVNACFSVNASGVGPLRSSLLKRSRACSIVGVCPAGTHQSTRCARSMRSNHRRRSRSGPMWSDRYVYS
jgi:hypothetical protein